MRVLISGYYGFNNAGDEAVLAAILQGLRERWPEVEATVLSADPAHTAKLHGVPAVQRWSVGQVWRALGRNDLLLQGGGSLLQDVTSRLSCVYYLGVLRMARMRRVPTVIFAQGVGPLRAAWLRRWARAEFSGAAAITVRDVQSLAELGAMGVKRPEPVVTADPALLLDPYDGGPAPEGSRETEGFGLLIIVRQWPGAQAAISACADLARHAAEDWGMPVAVAVFHEPDDLAAAEAVAAAHPAIRVLGGAEHPARFVAWVAGARLVVSMRLHGIIFAAAQAVPAVGISYDPKVDVFAARARQAAIPVQDCTAEALIAAAERALGTAQKDLERRRATAEELRQAAQRNFDVLGEVLAGVGGSPVPRDRARL